MANPGPSIEHLAAKYDVIIVGGGQAGLTLASRLTEVSTITVLVLEAGSPNLNDPVILTPPFASKLRGKEQYDWDFKTEPQVLHA